MISESEEQPVDLFVVKKGAKLIYRNKLLLYTYIS